MAPLPVANHFVAAMPFVMPAFAVAFLEMLTMSSAKSHLRFLGEGATVSAEDVLTEKACAFSVALARAQIGAE